MSLTYPEVGATRDGDLPAGYRHVRRRARVDAFEPLAEAIATWGIQRGAGLAVRPGAPRAAVGVEVAVGRLGLWAPARVVWVLDQPDRYGWAYGTLPGHPVSGEEAFMVGRDTGGVWFEVRAFSRPATLAGRLARPAQALITRRYLATARRRARG